MLNALKAETNYTLTENGAVTHRSTLSHCLDLFSTIGAIRKASEEEILSRFYKAFAEDRDLAMKTLFFARDIRGGLGERRVFRTIVKDLANREPAVLRKNIALIPEYGRFDDLLELMDTPCEKDALEAIRTQLQKDLEGEEVSLLAKWLPSVNASNMRTVLLGKKIADYLGMTDREYRKTLVDLREKIRILENNLREKDYTFDYSKQPSKAMHKYRQAFWRNDKERYGRFLKKVQQGKATLHTGTLMPYEIIAPLFSRGISAEERITMDTTWNALEDFGTEENALVVVDGSGSMYGWGEPRPIEVALSLGIYLAERNRGAFRNHFITFSETPQLVEIKGEDIAEKVQYCAKFNEVANTNLQAVFELILHTAVKYNLPQEELPQKLYIVSDMEFDMCAKGAELTNFDYAKRLYASHGYSLPQVVFWNVCSRNVQQPVTKNEVGVALISGCTPRLFAMVAGGITSPYQLMLDTLSSDRYASICA